MSATLFREWFGWPSGAVLTNLVASALWLSFASWKLVKWGRRVEASHADLRDMLDRLHVHLGVPAKDLP